MIDPYFKVSVRLDVITPLEPNDQGYPRTNTDTIADLTLTANSPDEVLFQASKHVLTLHDAYQRTETVR